MGHNPRDGRIITGVGTMNARNAITALALSIVLLDPTIGWAQPPEPGRPLVTIRELMEKTITPATNRLWDVPDAPTDQDWAELEEAAITLLVAAVVDGIGGTGPDDNKWTANPAYQAFNETMIAAGRDALAAVRARDKDALLTAGDALYSPCEACHLQFNPAVVEENR
jgi:hypothetical protein